MSCAKRLQREQAGAHKAFHEGLVSVHGLDRDEGA